jgi:hypothetical protein
MAILFSQQLAKPLACRMYQIQHVTFTFFLFHSIYEFNISNIPFIYLKYNYFNFKVLRYLFQSIELVFLMLN